MAGAEGGVVSTLNERVASALRWPAGVTWLTRKV